MADFFKPLLRKIGVLTLVVACVFAAAWAKSLNCGDHVVLRAGGYAILFLSNLERFYLCIRYRGDSSEGSATMAFWMSELSDLEAYFLYCGWFDFGSPVGPLIRADYWSIVIPLTMVSAWLLLSKPRVKSHAKPMTE